MPTPGSDPRSQASRRNHAGGRASVKRYTVTRRRSTRWSEPVPTSVHARRRATHKDYLPQPRAARAQPSPGQPFSNTLQGRARARLRGRSAARSGRRPRAPTGASATHCRTPRGQLRSEGERDEGARPAAAAARPPGKTRTVVRAHGTHGGSTRRAHHKTGQSVKTRRFERAVSKLLTGCSGQAAPP